MSLPTLFAGKSAPGLSAALDLRFALDKSLTAYRGPTPSFSRASTGSYFDASGVLRYAPVNLLNYSEDFTNAYWSIYSVNVSSNQAVAPDGKTTADKLYDDNTSNEKVIYRNPITVSAPVTQSVYMKAAERSFGCIQLYEGSGALRRFTVVYNLSNGTIANTRSVNGGTGTYGIESVGNGWYRCWATWSINWSNGTAHIALSDSANPAVWSASGFPQYAGNGSSGIYIWGAQLEASSTVGTYCPTTSSANSAPRFDHTFNGTSWVSRGLLVEEQRTNSLQYSESFNTSPYWAAAGGATITANQAVAPDGNTTADNVAGVNGFYQNSAGIGSSTATNTASIFAKANGSSSITLRINEWGSGINYVEGTFNLSNGTATATNGGSGSGATASMIDCGNGWYRCIITGKPSTTVGTCGYYPYGMTTSVYCWGAQFEAGASFATSYIPSTGAASTTRSADVCQITGSDFSGFWNGTEGSLACEFDRLSSVTSTFSSGFPHAVSLVDSGNLVRQGFYGGHSGASPTGEIFLYNGSGRITAGALVSGTSPIKISGAYKASDFAGSLNGATAVTSSSGSIDPVVQMNIGAWASSQYMLNGHIARLRYYRKRLPNETLQLLSEPDPTLNLQFALNKSLTPVAGPAPSFSRASTGTYFNASGVLTSASINTPRFDHVYSGGQWVSRGLLLEEQRTNYVKYANDLSTNWTNESGATREYNSVVSPDGGTNATKVNVAVADFSGIYQFPTLNSGSGIYTYSIFAKKGTKNWLWILNASGAGGTGTFFNIANGTLGNVYSGYSASIIDCGNGWYRCILTTSTTTPSWFQLGFSDSNNSVRPDSTGYSYVYGAQIEVGSFATSFIPNNTSSSVTRSADVCQITGTSFGWMYNQSEWSVALEYDQIGQTNNASKSVVLFSVSNGAGSYAGYYEDYTGNEYWKNYTTDYSIIVGSTSIGQLNKFAGCVKTNDVAATRNGAAVLTDTSTTMKTGQNNMGIGMVDNAAFWNGHIAKLIYYPARLTNTKLQQLST